MARQALLSSLGGYDRGPVTRANVMRGLAIGAATGASVAGGSMLISHAMQGPLIDGVRTISRHHTGWEVAGVLAGIALLGGAIGAFIGATPPAKKEPQEAPSGPPLAPIPTTLAQITPSGRGAANGTQFLSLSDVFAANAEIRPPLR